MKYIALPAFLLCLSGCQLISPIFVDYNGVRRDAAQWINQQTLLSMQQKRSLAQLSKAQQRLIGFAGKDSAVRFEITKENQIAMQCAKQQVNDKKIGQLQDQLFGDDKTAVLSQYQELAPMLKIDAASIQCE